MIITAKEFLEKSQKHGYCRPFYKKTMLDITDTLPFDLLEKEEQVLYLIAESKFSYIRYQSMKPELIPESEELYTEAFKLLNLIAD